MSDPHVVSGPVLAAIATAVLCLVVRRNVRLQRAVSVLGVFTYAGTVGLLAARVFPSEVLTYNLGGWPAPAAIVLVADGLSVFMLGIAATLTVPALLFSVRYVDDFGERLSFHPLFHLMLAGVSGAFLTGDIFNLFVWFEVMLMASYVLVVFYGGPEHTSAGLRYLVLNLVGSAVMLLAIGGLYATTGTLNMADIAHRVANPAAYRAAPAPVTAMLAGVVKKVGVYAIVRLYFTVFAATEFAALDLPWGDGSALAYLAPVVLAMAALSIGFGGFAAVGQDRIEDLLAYSSIGQVGFIVLPLSVAAVTEGSVQRLAVVAALVYALNHTLAKGLLFLAAGSIRDATGTTEFADLGGIARTQPVLAGAFLVGGLGLVGIPPLSGFFGKLLVFQAAVAAEAWTALAVALGGAVLTVAYVSRAWNRGFWGSTSPVVEHATVDQGQVALVAVLAAGVVLVGVGFDPVYRAAEHAARAALDTGAYIDAVLPEGGLDTSGGGH